MEHLLFGHPPSVLFSDGSASSPARFLTVPLVCSLSSVRPPWSVRAARLFWTCLLQTFPRVCGWLVFSLSDRGCRRARAQTVRSFFRGCRLCCCICESSPRPRSARVSPRSSRSRLAFCGTLGSVIRCLRTLIYLRERARARTGRDASRRRPAERRAQHRARSHDPETVTGAETETQTRN